MLRLRRLQRRFDDSGRGLSLIHISCPNRDGTLSSGGCTFCDNAAFSPSYCTPDKSVRRQLEEGIEFHRRRYRSAERYLAYFQSFSNTYAPLERLREVFSQEMCIRDR